MLIPHAAPPCRPAVLLPSAHEAQSWVRHRPSLSHQHSSQTVSSPGMLHLIRIQS